MNNVILVSPACTADSAKQLAELLDIPHCYIDDFEGATSEQRVINWGCSKIPHTKAEAIIFNKPGAVRRTLNKITAFSLLSPHVRMPVMTEDKDDAYGWAEEGRKVVVRNRVKGCKSQGITITNKPDDILNLEAKFYTRFIENCKEYRINVYKNKVLTVYYKLPCNGDFAFKIRLNEEDAWQAKVQDMITAVHEHIHLDEFGLDVLVSPKGKHFLLEVNSAPILFPITTRRLAKAIKKDFE